MKKPPDRRYKEWALAYMYEHGQGVTRSYADAVQWYRKAIQNANSG